MASTDKPPIQKYLLNTGTYDRLNPWRRYFSTPSPGLGRNLFIKRSTVPGECPDPNRIGQDRPVGRPKEALMNEARAIKYVRKHTTIPVPVVIAAFEDRDVFYLIQEHITGIPAQLAPKEAHPYIVEQLEGFVRQLEACRSDTVKSFLKGHLFTPERLRANQDLLDRAVYKKKKDRYVLCHGDLGWHNFYVEPETWKITVVFDWEFAGFFPLGMEGEYWRREGPACAAKRGDQPDKTDMVQAMYEARLRPVGSADEGTKLEDGDESYDHVEAAELEIRSMDEAVYPRPRPGNLTPLQTRLERLDLDYPEDLPVTHRTLCVQRAILTRGSIAESFKALAADMAEDVLATDSWVGATGDVDPIPRSNKNNGTFRPLHYEMLPFQALYELLPALTDQLGNQLAASQKPLHAIRDQFAHIGETRYGRDVQTEVKVESDEGGVKTTKTVNLKAMRANTYREVEGTKWRAFHEYATQLLRISQAALDLLPHLPEGTSTHPFTPQRILAEHRAKDIIEGNDGAWSIGCTDLPDRLAELKMRKGEEVSEWGMMHMRQLAEREVRFAEAAEKRKVMKEERDRKRAEGGLGGNGSGGEGVARKGAIGGGGDGGRGEGRGAEVEAKEKETEGEGKGKKEGEGKQTGFSKAKSVSASLKAVAEQAEAETSVWESTEADAH